MSQRPTQEESQRPATVEDILRAVVQLSQRDESEFQDLVSDGQLKKMFPFRPRTVEIPPDFEDERDIVRASALPLDREARRALIQASMPSAAAPLTVAAKQNEFDAFAALFEVAEDVEYSNQQASTHTHSRSG